MFGKDWQTSEPVFEVTVERDVAIPVDDDVELVGDVFRPDTEEPVPVILSASAYNTEFQSAPITPRLSSSQNAWMEAGDPYFFARRGYAHVIVNVRGTGKSGGKFRNLGPREAEDVAEAIAWLADRPWSDGSVGMFGISYFGMIQLPVAMLEPPALETIFAPWAASDLYRHARYHGGIFRQGFAYKWSQQLSNPRSYSWSRDNLSDEEFERRIERALSDEEIRAHPVIVEALENPDRDGVNPLLVDLTINHLDEPGGYFDERRVSFEHTDIPAYFGADWHHYRSHLAAGFHNFNNWDGPRKLLVGPPEFADRPLYQLGYESLRWFDHWLKDTDTGLMDELPIQLFMMGEGSWKAAKEWPLPETRWTPFNLHEGGVLDEKEHLPKEGYTTFEDSPFGRGRIEFTTPRFVERTEVLGPIPVRLFASTTDDEILLFVSLHVVDPDGQTTELTRGWLRGSQRRVDPERSEPWHYHHPHEEREPLTPNEVEEFRINVSPTGRQFEPGERISLRITSSDASSSGYSDLPHEGIRSANEKGQHLSRQSASRVTVYHNRASPSRLFLPITAGNVIGTYRSGGEAGDFDERMPYERIWMDTHSG